MGKIQFTVTDTAIVAKFKNDLSAFCVGSNQDFSWAATSLCTSSLGIFALLRLDLTPVSLMTASLSIMLPSSE